MDAAKAEETGTQAYLNILLFDEGLGFLDAAFVPVSTAAKENGTNVPHEKLSGEIVVQQPGYVYIYFSNDNDQPLEVFFDDFTVEHVHSAIVQADDYYPFGMTFNSYKRENSVANKYLYNGKELQEETAWLDYGQRMYQPEIGRFFTQDRFAEKYLDFSPYQYAANNPIKYIDVNGDSINIFGLWNNGEFDQKAWNTLSQGLYDVTGIELNKPTKEGEALTIGSVNKKVGSSGARKFLNTMLTSDNENFQLPLHINPEGYDRYANYDSGITKDSEGNITENKSEKKVMMNLNNINSIVQEGMDKRTLGVGFIYLHEAWHHLGRNDNTALYPPAGGVEAIVNQYREEMNLPQRLHYSPTKEGVINFGNINTREVKGRAILPAYKK